MRIFLMLPLLILVACGTRTDVISSAVEKKSECREINETEAARSALDYLNVSADQVPFQSSSKLKNGDWFIIFSENPDIPGNGVVLIVDRCGNVVSSEHDR